ncbi:MAG: hypothetical protein HY033_11135 [Ignavibacteriae bacterium]|nr:hypothetical protein [Ignavibacteria bacterium]MBI3365452.1 hypothetical protein [Ignavibacteriota bacterium]
MKTELGWLTKPEALKMVRNNFPNLRDYSDDDVVATLMGMGITPQVDPNAPIGETISFRFYSFKEFVREKQTALGRHPDAIKQVVENVQEWDEILRSQPLKRKP